MKLATVVISFVVSLWVSGAAFQPVSAATQPKSAEEKAPTKVTYAYVAQPGDCYSLIARKATQTYGLSNKIKLTLGQVLFVETHLTQVAGSPQLKVGERVTIIEDTVSAWVKKAQALTNADKKAWQVYAANVDFNTDRVGQP